MGNIGVFVGTFEDVAMQAELTELQHALEERRKLIDEWKTIGSPTPQDLLDRIDDNDRRILQLRQRLIEAGHADLPQ